MARYASSNTKHLVFNVWQQISQLPSHDAGAGRFDFHRHPERGRRGYGSDGLFARWRCVGDRKKLAALKATSIKRAELMSAAPMTSEVDILIVGGGPVGMTGALLAKHGLFVAEREAGIYPCRVRLISLKLRIFQTAGRRRVLATTWCRAL